MRGVLGDGGFRGGDGFSSRLQRFIGSSGILFENGQAVERLEEIGLGRECFVIERPGLLKCSFDEMGQRDSRGSDRRARGRGGVLPEDSGAVGLAKVQVKGGDPVGLLPGSGIRRRGPFEVVGGRLSPARVEQTSNDLAELALVVPGCRRR